MTTPRIILGNDGNGNFGLRVSRPGFDVTQTRSEEYTKMAFDTAWDRVENVHQAGTFKVRFESDSGPRSIVVFYPRLPYRPIVTIKNIGLGTQQFGFQDIKPDWWWTIDAGGTDPYMSPWVWQTEVDRFFLATDFLVTQFAEDNPSRGGTGGTDFGFQYVVWKLPGEVY